MTVTTAFFEYAGRRYPLRELGGVQRVEHGSWLQAQLFELWAWFRGHRVELFHSLDAREFNQVCRALTRARERAGLA